MGKSLRRSLAHYHGDGHRPETQKNRWPTLLADRVIIGLELLAAERAREEMQVVELCAAAAEERVPEAALMQTLRRLRNNLGHPSTPVSLRILKNVPL